MTQSIITIVTCTHNCADTLAKTIESVLMQTYQRVEHLFIDGGSTDGTLDIIRQYYKNPKLISEQDRGVYDAFNKGLKLAGGDIVGFLHSGDSFADKLCLERIASAFVDNDIDYYCSKMLICDVTTGKPFAVLGSKPHKPTWKDQLYSSTYYAHPTYYCRKEIIHKVGYFDLQYKIGGDIDWLIRLEKTTNHFWFDDRPMVLFRGDGGLSAKHNFTGLFEEFFIKKKHYGLSASLLFFFCYHLFRRSVRWILNKLKLHSLIEYSRRKIITLHSTDK